ncbi:hypothetical protein K435DRAFT_873931 [Dendrothele bispora CBS 962.96]|uniref:Uncharacterized protein n=1 Tax=Dendrothele bispora (strain CBS 962.96) TaxID=1314807 RepID=A0A4S8KXW5_DENBC|nr:hypothetical protein K435DRAFT_873931 [Dendrothele bispora CBS 962.96]
MAAIDWCASAKGLATVHKIHTLTLPWSVSYTQSNSEPKVWLRAYISYTPESSRLFAPTSMSKTQKKGRLLHVPEAAKVEENRARSASALPAAKSVDGGEEKEMDNYQGQKASG